MTNALERTLSTPLDSLIRYLNNKDKNTPKAKFSIFLTSVTNKHVTRISPIVKVAIKDAL